MFKIMEIETECSLCGQPSLQKAITSPDRAGLPDLDTRPPENLRSSLPFWVQRCPNCGYCAPDIDREYPLATYVVRQASYQALLRKRSLPQLARSFLAWGMIQQANGEGLSAGWSALHAAWACDDAEKPAAAVHCRQQALASFERARGHGRNLPGFEDPGAEEILLADLYRRTGQFERAVEVSRLGLGKQPSLVITRTLEHEIILATAKDDGQHSLSEVTVLIPGLIEVGREGTDQPERSN
jgi:hypothetical protein